VLWTTQRIHFVDYTCPGVRVEVYAFLQTFKFFYALRVSVTCTIILLANHPLIRTRLVRIIRLLHYTSFGLSVLPTVPFYELFMLYSYRKCGTLVSERLPTNSWTFIIRNAWIVCSEIISNSFAFMSTVSILFIRAASSCPCFVLTETQNYSAFLSLYWKFSVFWRICSKTELLSQRNAYC
jgi:hypothetical protein